MQLLTENNSHKFNEQRTLGILWSAQFIAMIGMSACIPFLPLFVRELGVAKADANLWSGIITAAPFIMSSALTPLWGVLGDKYGQKAMVVRAVFGLGIAMTLMGFSVNIWMLLGMRIFQGAASGFIASTNAFVSAQSSPERVSRSLSVLQTSISAGNIIGPLIGGVISDTFNFRSVFFFVGVMCFVSMLIVVLYVHEDKSKVRGNSDHSVLGNIRLAWNIPQIQRALVMILLTQTALVLTTPIFPFYLEQLGAPTAMLSSLAGGIVSIVGVCTIIGAPFWGKRADTIGFRTTLMFVTTIVALFTAIQAFVPSYHWLFPTRIVLGLHAAAIIPVLYGQLTRLAPQGRKGGIMGLGSSVTLLGNLIGPLLCSAIAFVLPLQFTFIASATLMAIVFVLSSFRQKNEPKSEV